MTLIHGNATRKVVPMPPLDPAITTPRNMADHLRGSDAIATITEALIGIGVHPVVAKEHATACVQRTFNELRGPVAFHCAETIWRRTMGDDSGATGFALYAEQGQKARDTAVKILRDVEDILAEADRCYQGRWTVTERVRAASHRGQFAQAIQTAGRTFQQRVDAITARMTPPDGAAS